MTPLPCREALLVCLRVFNRRCGSYPFPPLSFHAMSKVTSISSVASGPVTTWQLSPITEHFQCSRVMLQNVMRWRTSSTATDTYVLAWTCTTSSVRHQIRTTTNFPRPRQITDPLLHTYRVGHCHAALCRNHRFTCAGAMPSMMPIMSTRCRNHHHVVMPAFSPLLRITRPFFQAPPRLWRGPSW